VKGAHRAALLAALAAQLGAAPAPAAEALSTELNRCVVIASAEARLACYDKLAGRSAASATSGSLPAATPAAPTASAATMPANTAPPRAAVAPAAAAAAASTLAAAPAPVTAAVVPPDPAAAAQNFGLSSAPLHSAPQSLQSIEARISEVGADRSLRSYVVLDNGQTWLSTDGGMELNSGEQVTIKHAALGSFMLVATTSNHSYHVRRIR
jgi:hypothetical protein